jgi:hypothetical protein
MKCDNCGKHIAIGEGLRLVKWRERYGEVIRWWVCMACWRRMYHGEVQHEQSV